MATTYLKANVNGTKITMKEVKTGWKVSQAGFYREFTDKVEAAEWFAKCVSEVANMFAREVKDIQTARMNLKKELQGE